MKPYAVALIVLLLAGGAALAARPAQAPRPPQAPPIEDEGPGPLPRPRPRPTPAPAPAVGQPVIYSYVVPGPTYGYPPAPAFPQGPSYCQPAPAFHQGPSYFQPAFAPAPSFGGLGGGGFMRGGGGGRCGPGG